MKRAFLALSILALLAASANADEAERVVKRLQLPDRAGTVVVSEGDLEPRSAGSYSLRVYSSKNPDFPFDDFVAGIVRSRDGVVKDLKFVNLGGRYPRAIIVVIQSA